MTTSKHKGQFSRREFLHLVSTLGGAAALSSFLQACSQAGIDPTQVLSPTIPPTTLSPTNISDPTATASQEMIESSESSPSPTDSPMEATTLGTSQVAFVKTRDRTQGVRQAVEMLGLTDVHSKIIFIKPNFNSPDPTPGSTHPDILRTIVSMLHEKGAGQITVGDRSGMGDTRYTMEKIGVFQMAEELDFNLLIFDDMPAEDWIMIQPPKSHWQQGFPFAHPCLESDAIIQTCCLKTHRFGGHFTMSLKNSVGMVAKRNLVDNHDFMRELHSSPHQRRMIAEVNTAYNPDLIVLDGVEAFISGGPDNGGRAFSEVVLAGKDRVAIDAVGVALLRYHGCQTEVAHGKIFEQDQLERAVQLGLGVDSPDKIKFLTGDAESAAYAARIQEILLS